MRKLRPSAPQLADIEPYDPKYIPADVMISANESPVDLPDDIRAEVQEAVRNVNLNRYPDPLANDLRDMIASANGLVRDQVILGNGGDELLFNIALAFGGPGRTFLNMPPTFSVYVNNAQLTNTTIVNVNRRSDFTIDEEAVIERVAQGDIDYTIVTSPNNPSGDVASIDFVERLLNASDTLVMVDEAYSEFSGQTVLPLLAEHENLVILHTFSKAYRLAGVRLGYLLGSEAALTEFKKVRQPYSVDAVSQAIGRVVYAHRDEFTAAIDKTIAERERVSAELANIEGVEAFPSRSNYMLVRIDDAGTVWQQMFDRGVLIRDFSHAPGLTNCLRISVGTPEENDRMLATLKDILAAR